MKEMNMNTGQIHKFLDRDSLYATEALDPTVISRWYSIDPQTQKYPHHSPYLFSDNSPIAINDPDGEDGVLKVKGNNITIKSTIYIYGSAASKSQAAKMQKNIMNDWNKGWTYTNPRTGQVYNVKFDVQVKLLDSKNPTRQIKWSDYGKSADANYIEVGTKSTIKRSYVRDGRYGEWRGYGNDPSSHEFGHLVGEDDYYYEPGTLGYKIHRGTHPGWVGNVMAEPAQQGTVQQKNIDDILEEFIIDLLIYEGLNLLHNEIYGNDYEEEIKLDAGEILKDGGEGHTHSHENVSTEASSSSDSDDSDSGSNSDKETKPTAKPSFY